MFSICILKFYYQLNEVFDNSLKKCSSWEGRATQAGEHQAVESQINEEAEAQS